MRVGRQLAVIFRIPLAGVAFLVLGLAPNARSQDPAAPRAPRDLVVDSERLASGLPLGGLGTGTIDLLTDGSLGNVAFANAWDRPLRETKGSFFALSAQAAGGTRVTRSLRHDDPLGLPSVARTLFHGIFPRAFVDYPDPELPLRVSLEAFSPLVPHDEKSSSLPVAFFTFRLENRGPSAVDASLLFSLENTIGAGASGGVDRTGNVASWREEGFFRGLVFGRLGPKSGEKAPPAASDAALGDVTLLAPAGDGITVTGRRSWNVLSEAPTLFEDFSKDGDLSPLDDERPAAPGLEGSWHPAGAIVARKRIEPRGAATFTFVLAWNFPRLVFPDGGDFGHFHSRSFEDSFRVALHARDRLESLREGTAAWQDLLLASNLPSWLAEKLANDLAPLATHSLYAKDGRFALLETRGDADARIGTSVGRLLAQPALLAFFPGLDAASIRHAAKSQSRSGEIPRALGAWRSGFDRPPAEPGAAGRVEATSAFVIQAATHAVATGDSGFERELYPHVRDAVRFLASLDRDGDGLPDTQEASLGGAMGASAGACDWFLAALRAAGELARRDGDVNFAGECDRRLGEGVRAMAGVLWNGRFFERAADPRSSARSSDCAIEQLSGTAALLAGGFAPALPETTARAAVRSLLELNGRAGGRLPSDVVGPNGAPLGPAAGEAPSSTLALASAVLSSLAFRFAAPEDGLEILRASDVAARSVDKRPWAVGAESSAWDGRSRGEASSATALGSWHALQSLAGFASDFDAGRLRTAPRLSARWTSLHVPLFSPRFSADFRLARVDSGPDREAALEVLSLAGTEPLELREWEIGIEETSATDRVSILVESPRGVERGTWRVAGDRARFTFDDPLRLGPGDGVRAHVGFGEAHQVLFTPGTPGSATSFGADVLVEPAAGDAQSARLTIENRGSGRPFVWLRLRPGASGTKAFSGQREIFVDGRSAGVVDGADLEAGRGVWLKPRVVDREAADALAGVVARMRERLPALRNTSRGSIPAPASEVESWLRHAIDFLAVERAARTSEVAIVPAGTPMKKEPAPPPKPAEARASLAGLEQAAAELRTALSRASATPEARSAWLDAMTPIDVDVVAMSEALPGETAPIRCVARNPFRLPLSGKLDVRFEEGLEARAVSLESDLDRSFVVRVDPRLPRRRYRVETDAAITVGDASYRVAAARPIGHAPLRDFLVIGPFDDPDGSAFAAPFPPETSIDLEASVPVRGGTARWRKYDGAGDSVDLDSVFAPDHESALAYALTHVECPTERDAWLELGFDEGLRVFLNGAPVFEARHPERTARFGEARVKLKLAKGTNRLLFKSAQTSGPWRFFAELTDASGFTFPDVTTSASGTPRDAR